MQGKRIVKEPNDNGKYENMFLPEILEGAKKKCCAWFGVSNVSFWRIDQTSLGIMGWAFSEEQTTSAETQVDKMGFVRSESADWDSEKSSQMWIRGRQSMTRTKRKSTRNVRRLSRSLLQPLTTSWSMTHGIQR